MYDAPDICWAYPRVHRVCVCSGRMCGAVETCSLWNHFLGTSIFCVHGSISRLHRVSGLRSFLLSYCSSRCLSKKQKQAEYYGIKGFIIEIGPSSDTRDGRGKRRSCRGARGLGSFMGSPRGGVGGSEVGGAEGTTREGYSEVSKICCLPVCVVLSRVVADGQSLCSSTGPWGQKGEGRRQGWAPPAHTESSGRGGLSLTFTLEIRGGESSPEWELPGDKWAKFNTTSSVAMKNHTPALFLKTVHSVY